MLSFVGDIARSWCVFFFMKRVALAPVRACVNKIVLLFPSAHQNRAKKCVHSIKFRCSRSLYSYFVPCSFAQRQVCRYAVIILDGVILMGLR